MSFSKTWDEAVPDGATANANDIDLFIKDTKIAVRERLTSITGVASGDFNTDPFAPTKYGPAVTITTKNVHPTTVYDNGSVISGAVTVNYANGNDQKVTLASNTTITLTGGTIAGQVFILDVINSGTFTTSWGSNVRHTNNTAPSPTVSANTSSLYHFRWNGSVWQCTLSNTGVPTT